MSYRHILVATGLEGDAVALVRRASELAAATGARLTMLYVEERLPGDVPNDLVPPEDVDKTDYQLEQARCRLRDVAAQLEVKPHAVEALTGGAEDVIARYAAEHAVDLIVVGSHDAGAAGRLLGKATAEGILQHRPCDVLAVRLPT